VPVCVCGVAASSTTSRTCYHALYAYFDRDNVALPGLARYVPPPALATSVALPALPAAVCLYCAVQNHRARRQCLFCAVSTCSFFKASSEEEREHAEKLRGAPGQSAGRWIPWEAQRRRLPLCKAPRASSASLPAPLECTLSAPVVGAPPCPHHLFIHCCPALCSLRAWAAEQEGWAREAAVHSYASHHRV